MGRNGLYVELTKCGKTNFPRIQAILYLLYSILPGYSGDKIAQDSSLRCRSLRHLFKYYHRKHFQKTSRRASIV